jgi:hypothetical protein
MKGEVKSEGIKNEAFSGSSFFMPSLFYCELPLIKPLQEV